MERAPWVAPPFTEYDGVSRSDWFAAWVPETPQIRKDRAL